MPPEAALDLWQMGASEQNTPVPLPSIETTLRHVLHCLPELPGRTELQVPRAPGLST